MALWVALLDTRGCLFAYEVYIESVLSRKLFTLVSGVSRPRRCACRQAACCVWLHIATIDVVTYVKQNSLQATRYKLPQLEIFTFASGGAENLGENLEFTPK